MAKCALDIKKDIIDEAGEMLAKKGAIITVGENVGYFPNINKWSSGVESVNRAFKSLIVKAGEKGSFFIDPPDELVQEYFEEYKKNLGELTEENFRPEGFYMGDEALAEQEKKDLFFQVGSGAVFTEKLKEKLMAFLKGLNIKVEFNADEILSSKGYSKNPLAAFDVLQKFMAFASGQERLLPQQVAATMYTFLGKKSTLSKALWFNIEKWEKYREVYDRYDQMVRPYEDVNVEDEWAYEKEFVNRRRFNVFAHKMAIIKFLEESIMRVEAGDKAITKRINEDIDKDYFLRRGRLDVFEKDISELDKVFRRFYNWMLDLLGELTGNPIFERYDRNDLTQIGLDIAEDTLKGDYKKFIRGIFEKDGKLYTADGNELELKDYEKTLRNNIKATRILEALIDNPFINFKLSGSLTLRKYGTLFRWVREDLHDIDGVIPLETFRQEPSAREFMMWLQSEGLPMMRNRQGKKFAKEIRPFIEEMIWYKNVQQVLPNFTLTNAFVGRDHKKGESVTIQGESVIDGVTYKWDFFLRTDEGNYPEIFDNYWKDWKQIFEAKLNMGRAKDIVDLVYFDPFISDKFKFTNKGFRYFAFAEDPSVQTQFGNMPASKASDETLNKVKEAAKKMGIDIQALTEYTKNNPDIDLTNVNGVADLVRGVIALSEGMENVALTEEMVHIATAILEQTNPEVVTEMIKNIDKYKIYKKVFEAYKDNKYYQTADGKPNIRKIKKEAVDKLITEIIIKQNEGSTEFPELMEEEVQGIFQRLWSKIKGLISKLYKKANVNIFQDVARMVATGEVGGTVTDIASKDIFFQLSDTQKNLQEKILNQQDKLKKETSTEPADPVLMDSEEASNYYNAKQSDGTFRRVKNRVTDRVKAYYYKLFGQKVFSEQEKEFNELKRKYGIKGHNDLQEIHARYYNPDGTKKAKPDPRPKKINLDSMEMYDKLETYFADLVKSLPKDTLIMSEVMIYDPTLDEAGTLDFLAIEPSGKTHILDWKFMHIRGDDVAWYKQGAFNVQLGRYKEMLKKNYGVTNFGMTRAIPVSMDFSLKNRFDPSKGFKLSGIAIGSVDTNKIEEIKLIPIAEESESTGEEELDELIKKLNALLKQESGKQVTETEKEFKRLRMETLRQTIRIIQATKNIAPVIDVIEVMRKEGERILNDYNVTYKNRPATSADSTNGELSDFSDDMNEYMATSEIFVNIGRDIGHLIYNAEMAKDAKTKKQKEQLALRREALDKLNSEADAIYRSRAKILKASREFADKHIGQRNLVVGLLRPEKVIQGLSSMFRGISDLPSAALSVLSKLTSLAMSNAAADSLKEVERIMGIRNRIIEKGGDPRQMLKKLYQKDDKGNSVNKLIYKYSNKFRETVNDKFNQGGDRKWLVENIDVDAYMKEAKEVMSKRIEQIKKQTFPGDKQQVAKRKKELIDQVIRQFDITRLDFDGGNNYIIKRHPLPKWFSEEYKEIEKDPDLKALYDEIIEINEKAKDIGYINNMSAKTFLPYVRKGMAESLAWDNVLSAMGKWNDAFTLRVDDVGYGKVNEITGELENSIPKYYTHDFTKGEDGVNDYSDVSEDLFKNLILYVQQINKYKYLTEVEGQIKLVKTIEELKEYHINTTRTGDIIMKGNQPDLVAGNKENSKMFDEFMRAVLYGQKYVLSSSDTPLYIGKVFNFMKGVVNKLAGREVFKPNEDVKPTSLVKTIDAANRGFQLKTLGLEIFPGLVNLFGGNVQIATQMGHYFKFSDFTKNERQVLSLEFKNDEDKDAFIQLINTFLPMREDPSYELYKEAGMSKLTRNNLGDILMVMMRYPEQLIEKASFLSLLDNMMVVDGKIVSIPEYVKSRYKNRYASAAIAKEAKQKIEEEIAQLKETQAISVTRRIEDGKLVIPGLDLSNRNELLRVSNLAKRISRNATGSLSETDINRMQMSIWTRSMMVFKNWIPKLLDTRFSEFRKISDDFSVVVDENGMSEGEKFDIGRLRLLGYVFMKSFHEKGSSIRDILNMTDKGLTALNEMYDDFARTYYERNGEVLTMTREDFIDMVNTNLRNQLRELALLAMLFASAIALGYMAPDDDDDKASKNFFRYSQRVVDKFVSELSFFYNPLEMEDLLSGNAFPAIGLVTDITKFFSHFWMQTTGIDLSDPTKTFEEVREKAKPIKYAAKSLPVAKAALTWGAILSNDFAKEFDITIQKEARR